MPSNDNNDKKKSTLYNKDCRESRKIEQLREFLFKYATTTTAKKSIHVLSKPTTLDKVLLENA